MSGIEPHSTIYPQKSAIMLGSFYALLAFFCMAMFGILTKIALKEGSPLWVSFISYIAGAMLLLPYIARAEFGYLASNNYSFLFGRAFFGTLASFLYTLSIKSIPVVNGTLLFNTAPIFIPVLGTLFFQTKIAKSIWVAVSFGFLGVIVIIKPTAAYDRKIRLDFPQQVTHQSVMNY